MKMIYKGMIDARTLEDCFEKRKNKILANYVEIKNCEQTPYVKDVLEKCNIPTSVCSCLSQTNDTYGHDCLTIAIVHMVLNQDVPEKVWQILEETMSDDALKLLRLLEIMIRKDFP